MRRRADESKLVDQRARVRADLDPYLRRLPGRSDPEVIVVPADTGRARRAIRTLYRWLSGRRTPDRLQLSLRDLHHDSLECLWTVVGKEFRLRGRTAIETPIGGSDDWYGVATARIPYERIRHADLTGRDEDGLPRLEVTYGVTGPFTGWAVLGFDGEVPVRTLLPRPRSERAFAWWLARQRRRRRLAPPQYVARDLDRYLTAPGDEAAASQLLESVSRLLEELLEDGPGWGDDDHCWLDGIHPRSMEATGPHHAVITGHAWVGGREGKLFRLRPVHAELRRRPAISHIFMASIEHEVAYDVSVLDETTGGRWPSRVTDRMVVPPDPVNWSHAHALVLPPTPPPARAPWWWTGLTPIPSPRRRRWGAAHTGAGTRSRGQIPPTPPGG